MLELAALLQDVPVEERTDAMQYYNDYFDAAGEENEQKVISELESPKKVAEKLKAGLDGRSDLGGASQKMVIRIFSLTVGKCRYPESIHMSRVGQKNVYL